jgi:hypothetical protein
MWWFSSTGGTVLCAANSQRHAGLERSRTALLAFKGARTAPPHHPGGPAHPAGGRPLMGRAAHPAEAKVAIRIPLCLSSSWGVPFAKPAAAGGGFSPPEVLRARSKPESMCMYVHARPSASASASEAQRCNCNYNGPRPGTTVVSGENFHLALQWLFGGSK